MIHNKKLNQWNTINDTELLDLLESWTAILVKIETATYSRCLIWCLHHSQGKFIDRAFEDDRVWYFENEQDAVMFAIQFGN